MPKLNEILGESFNSLPDDIKAKYKDIDLVDISDGAYVKKTEVENKDIELNTIKGQLKEANKKIQSYKDMDVESIKQSAEEWKAKYDTDTKALKETMAKKDYEYKANDFLRNYDFLNDRVKGSVVKDFMSKEFKLEEGKFLGAEDWINNLKENEPEIFKAATKEPDIKGPKFTKQTQINPGDRKLSLTELMQAKNENPNMDIQ